MERTIREWVDLFVKGTFDNTLIDVQIDAGWYDWFCMDSLLAGKTRKIGKILGKISNTTLLDRYRIWFKNNCPMCHPLYDDFRFEPLDESLRDKMYFVVTINERNWKIDGKYKVYTARNGYKLEFSANTEKELVNKLEVLVDDLWG